VDHPEGDLLRRFVSRIGLQLPPFAIRRLGAFSQLLVERAVPLGLVGEADPEVVLIRHVLDCLRAAKLLRPNDGLAYDIGTGAGLPGVVLASASPRLRVRLVESRRRAVAFVELAVERLRLKNVEIFYGRAQDVDEPAEVATARAFAPMDRAWAAAVPLLRPGGRLIYFAGEGLQDPEAAAGSLTHPEPPASVHVDPVVENAAPLVIMARST
jgi:16S rRNA (guanine527-N7)-methyltransferase